MDSQTGGESAVGKTVDEWVMVDDGEQEYYVGMVGELTTVGGEMSFVAAAGGPDEVVLVGPPDESGHRRIGVHRAKS